MFVCLHPLFFWHRRWSRSHNSPRGIHSTPLLIVFCAKAHQPIPIAFPLASIPAKFRSNTPLQCTIRDKHREMILSVQEDGLRHKAFSTLVDSCHTIPSTPPWTWSRLEPSVAAAYLPWAAPSRAPTQTPQAGQTGCYKLGSRIVAIFTRC